MLPEGKEVQGPIRPAEQRDQGYRPGGGGPSAVPQDQISALRKYRQTCQSRSKFCGSEKFLQLQRCPLRNRHNYKCLQAGDLAVRSARS